jgi:hypothetical protein
MIGNRRLGLLTAALFLGIAAPGCSAPSDAPHLVHAKAEVAGSMSGTSSGTTKTAAIKPKAMGLSDESGVQIVELNGVYQGCVQMSGAWSVAVNGNDGIVLDNPPLEVVQADFNCQLLVTSVRADQIYTASSPIQTGEFGPQQTSSFTVASEDGGAPQVAFYANAWNMDPGYFGDFTLFFFYSPGPNQTSAGTTATYTTNAARDAQTDELPAPDYSVDLSQMTIQTDANGWVTSATGPANFTFNSVQANGYVIDDGTLPANPTFGELDALYTSQSPTQLTCCGNWSFSIDASALSIQWTQLPAVRNVVIGGGWGGLSTYQNVAITFSPPSGSTPQREKPILSATK